MDTELITGMLVDTQKPVLFVAEKGHYRFCFLTDSIRPSFPWQNTELKKVEVTSSKGFVFGKTHDAKDIAIYVGNDAFSVFGSCRINTDFYILYAGSYDSTSLNEFDEITFHGGTLNNVFNMNAMDFQSSIDVTIKDDSKKYLITLDLGNIDVTIKSNVEFIAGIHGNSIKNECVSLSLRFSSKQKINQITGFARTILAMLSFMTGRKNVGFDSITLSRYEPDKYLYAKTADVFLKNESIELTQKKYYENITVEDLGACFANLFKLCYNTYTNSSHNISDEQRIPPLSFLPENDKDANCISNIKIREICTAIEHELRITKDINVKQNEAIEELRTIIKQQIREYRKTNHTITNDAYNLINNTITEWSISLRERVVALCTKYSNELSILNSAYDKINEQNIKDFVDYRNSTTHGVQASLTKSIAETGFCLSGIIYCCVLDRIGVERTKIEQICREKILN